MATLLGQQAGLACSGPSTPWSRRSQLLAAPLRLPASRPGVAAQWAALPPAATANRGGLASTSSSLPLAALLRQPAGLRLRLPARRCRLRLQPCCASSESGSGSGGSSGGSRESSGSSAGTSSGGSSSSSSEPPAERPPQQPPKSSRRNSPSSSNASWLSRLLTKLKAVQPLRIVVNILTLIFLLRFWPVPGGRSPLGGVEPITVQVAFSEFVRQVQKNEVRRVVIDSSSNTFTFALRDSSPLYKMLPESLDRQHLTFQTVRPGDYPTPYELMLKQGVQFSAVDKKAGRLTTLMTYAASALIVIAVLNRLPIKLLPGQRGTGRRHSSSTSVQNPVTFEDVAGVDEAKEELKEIVEFLKLPDKFTRLGARPPSGVLLVGPPGTGKTLLARAVAGEAGVPFFSVSASEFVELYVGMGAMRVRELFATARKEAPAIVFIDEIDAVAKGRDSRLRSVGNDEREQTLNQLLTELDGFDSHREQLVICIAATNRPDVLDAALLRPGRFDRRVAVERPDKQGREEILRVHINQRGLPLGDDVRVDQLAAQTTGFTGADLANLVNEAALLAGRGNKGIVSNADFDSAVLRAVAGIEKKRSVLQGVEKSVVARHEVGHALVATAVAALLPGFAGQAEKLSIIPRTGGALGFTYIPPKTEDRPLGFTYIPPKTEDRALMFDREIRGQLAMLMGGRAAEEVSCDAVSTGAMDDIRRATDLAYKAVSEYGLSASVGPLSVGTLISGGDDYGLLKDSGSPVARAVEAEVKLMLEAALAVARDCVTANRPLHDALSAELRQEEKVEGAALQQQQRWHDAGHTSGSPTAPYTQRSGFSTAAAASSLEEGVVQGAKVTWADSGSSLKLRRRCTLVWDKGDSQDKAILIVKKPGDHAASQKLKELGTWLKKHGLRVLVERPVSAGEFSEFEPFKAQQAGDVDLCITLGGDGTVLHLASLFGSDDAPLPPVISFAMGTLGFLTPFNASMARTVLSRLLWPPWEGEPVFCTLRSRKECQVFWNGQLQRVHHVLNECLIDRGASPAMVQLECFVDGSHITTAQADGLIIATPSGSTAYSMSAGGPMVAPSVPCSLLVPVAPHSLSFRPLVVPEQSVIEVHLPQSSRSHARASFDGRHTMRMLRDSSIVCRTSRYALPMINMHPLDEDWYEGITQKLSWTGSTLRSFGGSGGPYHRGRGERGER
ncbi:ATP-dependent zinc metalloprotease FTSH chloroplastic isoform A [Chlorella sorokiniana]|uniref:ATP-dependent zinc metalloprotease FTSH chloroplastic isoform A n=1 Tax=Chlorella sorokiniana TaxID=3076 RepID=A0A2P6TP32_CHLSO|nr:ATP-dependent zinc metalloprotease FTSH chloroplastic isoform A [Chlorella sorokiniana]|eukprot:PRW51101.1 ATP-dependent zinc metalloprotease FTSH chloroplastic isoform A [Chlorella sorokiniana]